MIELTIGITCFAFGVLITNLIWMVYLDITSTNADNENHIIHEVVDRLKEKSDEEDRR